MAKVSKDSILSNAVWEFAEKIGAQFFSFLISIILARIIDPAHYGLVSLTMTFMSVLKLLVDFGLASSLIQKQDADELDFSTVFFANIVLCVVVYGLLYVTAPLVAWFYREESLTAILRVIGIILLFMGIKNVQQAYISKYMLFKKFFFASLLGTILGAVIAYIMAIHDYGPWAYVTFHLVDVGVDTVIIWFTVGWKPKMMFSFERLKSLYGFGSQVMAGTMINTLYDDFVSLMVGKIYTSEMLALYQRGRRFPQVISKNINGTINNILFPVMSAVNDDIEELKKMVKKSLQVCSYVMWPLMAGLFIMAENTIIFILTKTWVEATPYLQAFCVFYVLVPFNGPNISALKAVGRSDLYLKSSNWKRAISLVIFLIAINFDTRWLISSFIASALINVYFETKYSGELFDFPLSEQIMAIMPYVAMSVIMDIPVYFVGKLAIAMKYKIILQVLTGMIVYIAESIIFKIDAFYYLYDYLKHLINKISQKIKKKAAR